MRLLSNRRHNPKSCSFITLSDIKLFCIESSHSSPHLASVPTYLQFFKYSEPALSSCCFPHEEVEYVFDIHSLHIWVTGHALNENKCLAGLEATPGCPHELTCQSQLNCVAQDVPFMSSLTYLFLTLRLNPKWKQDFTFIDSDSFFFSFASMFLFCFWFLVIC